MHRLDKITSGLLILAIGKDNAALFSKMFRKKSIDKYYIAISDKKPKKKQGTVTGDIVKARRGSFKLTHSRENPSVTKFYSVKIEENRWFFILRLITGKTHQARVVMKSLGSPLFGDPLYNSQTKDTADRPYLHCYRINFKYKGRNYKFTNIPESGKLFTKDISNIIEKCQFIPE